MSVWTWKDESDTHLHELSNHLKARNTTVPDHTRLSTHFSSNHSRIVLIDWMKSVTKFDLIFSLTFIFLFLFLTFSFFFLFFFYLPAHFFIILNSLQMATVLFVFFQHFLKKWSKKIAAVDTFCMENFFSFSHSLFTKIQKTLTGKEYKTKWWRLRTED